MKARQTMSEQSKGVEWNPATKELTVRFATDNPAEQIVAIAKALLERGWYYQWADLTRLAETIVEEADDE
jgi:hypothetical protein